MIKKSLCTWRWPLQNTFGMWTVLYWTPSSRTQFGVSINVWRLAGDTLNITCKFLYCNHQEHRDFLITLYKSTVRRKDQARTRQFENSLLCFRNPYPGLNNALRPSIARGTQSMGKTQSRLGRLAYVFLRFPCTKYKHIQKTVCLSPPACLYAGSQYFETTGWSMMTPSMGTG